ncbi:MAG: putative toxin-antitoxin system toxin component, PIN family [Anaerolineales bacterium]
MRAVFDTNALVSALLFELSVPAQAFFTAMDTGEILLSATLVNEVNAVLQRKKFKKYISTEQREEFLIALVQWGRLVEITETIAVCRDPKDNHVLELAISGGAQVIVTGDSDLLVLNPFKTIQILTPRDFLSVSE